MSRRSPVRCARAPRRPERIVSSSWTFDGRLVGQWAHTGQTELGVGQFEGTPDVPNDIAAVGDRLFSSSEHRIWARSSALDPDWLRHLPDARLIALDADETAVAAFDAAGSRVIVWDLDGRQTADWPLVADGRAVAASDLSAGGGRVYIADTGRNRVLVRSLAGDDLGEWRVHDGPQRLDMAPGGDVVVLGRGGWGLRYTADGALRAAWRMPGAIGAKRAEGTDITAGPDGSVYVTYSRVKVGSAVDRARRVLVPLLGALDPSVVDVGLVTFGDGAALQTVLSDDIADLRSRILRAQADGDTRMGAGVDLAHGELNGPRRVADARRAIVIVSDGVFKDDPRAAIAAARADAINVHALIVTTPEFTADVRASLVAMLGAGHLHLDPSPDRAKSVIDAIGAWQVEPNVFETLTVRDVVPANMRFVAGSAVPPAAWDAATRTLTWTLAPRPIGTRVRLAYAVVPEEAGHWPTNVEADVTWRDVRGGAGQLRFPVPSVDVVTGLRVFLPFAVRQQCTSWSRPLDLVLVHDISSSMAEPSADGVRTKLEVAADAALIFLERMNPARDRIGVVTFDAQATVVAPLSDDRRTAVAALASMRPGYGTRIDRGLQAAIDLVMGDMRALALPVIVLLSDGLQNGPADTVRALLPELRSTGARVFVVGYGTVRDDDLLRAIAGDAADYRVAPAVEDLRSVYEGVGRTLLCP